MKRLLKEQGFTLVELMVVVAIIGILSAVAIPNFKTYQAKSKTSEAKLQLASIYSAETSLMGDYDAYATCLPFAGYVAPSAQNYYATGFSAANDTANNMVTNNGGLDCVSTTANAGEHNFEARKVVGGSVVAAADTDTALGAIDTTVMDNDGLADGITTTVVLDDGSGFVAGAIGFIDTAAVDTDYTTASQWAVDENKQMLERNRGY